VKRLLVKELSQVMSTGPKRQELDDFEINQNSAPEPDCSHARITNRRIDFEMEIKRSAERNRAEDWPPGEYDRDANEFFMRD